jgi:hypothetical protein
VLDVSPGGLDDTDDSELRLCLPHRLQQCVGDNIAVPADTKAQHSQSPGHLLPIIPRDVESVVRRRVRDEPSSAALGGMAEPPAAVAFTVPTTQAGGYS